MLSANPSHHTDVLRTEEAQDLSPVALHWTSLTSSVVDKSWKVCCSSASTLSEHCQGTEPPNAQLGHCNRGTHAGVYPAFPPPPGVNSE